MYLQKETSRSYRYVNPVDGKVYTLCFDDTGERSLGAAWFLQVRDGAEIKSLATFCIRSDGAGLEKRCYDRKIFDVMEAVSEAERIINKLEVRRVVVKFTGEDMVAAVPEGLAAIA